MKTELWWCCGGALQRLDAAAMAGTLQMCGAAMEMRWWPVVAAAAQNKLHGGVVVCVRSAAMV